MNNFEEWLTDTLRESYTLLGSVKLQEYAKPANRLHNFDAAAGVLKSIYSVIEHKNDNYDALIGMWVKHFISVIDLIQSLRDNMEEGPIAQTQDFMSLSEAKNGDNINYMILLKYMIDRDVDYIRQRNITFHDEGPLI